MPTVPDEPRGERAHYQGEYEPGRLRRGAARAVKKIGPRQYRVAGNEQPYYDVSLDTDPPCYCKDAEYHGRGCCHELAARLHDGDAALIMGLGMMLVEQEKRHEEAEGQLEKDLRASLAAVKKAKTGGAP
jgi:hypothetical protein